MSDEPDPRLHAYRPDLADFRLRGRVRADRFVEGRPAHVRSALADLRRRPASSAPLETQALHGEDLLVFEEPGEGWSWAQLCRDGYVGWIESEALSAGFCEPTHEIAVPRTFVFSGPDIKSAPLGALTLGARIAARAEASDRNATYRLVAPIGAIVSQHLRPCGARSQDPVAMAEGLLGAPYLWGGKSVLGIDCSGLVQLACHMAGIAAPRDADMQEAWSRPLAHDETPRRGDLVFWNGHVGLLLDAERLLHANAHHMMTAVEPLEAAIARFRAKGVPLRSIRRPPSAEAQ